MQERRKITRWPLGQEAKIQLQGAVVAAPCRIKDINFKGMQVVLKLKLQVDKYLKFRLFLSPESSFDLEAWVAWNKNIEGRNTYGIYFSSITEEDKQKIYKFVYKNTPEKGGEKDMEDRRIFQRFNMRLPVRLLDLNSGSEMEAQTTDVSAKGLGIALKEELKSGTPVEAWLSMPDKGEPLYTRGVAVWSKGDSSGFRVGVDLEKADLMGLSRLLRA